MQLTGNLTDIIDRNAQELLREGDVREDAFLQMEIDLAAEVQIRREQHPIPPVIINEDAYWEHYNRLQIEESQEDSPEKPYFVPENNPAKVQRADKKTLNTKLDHRRKTSPEKRWTETITDRLRPKEIVDENYETPEIDEGVRVLATLNREYARIKGMINRIIKAKKKDEKSDEHGRLVPYTHHLGYIQDNIREVIAQLEKYASLQTRTNSAVSREAAKRRAWPDYTTRDRIIHRAQRYASPKKVDHSLAEIVLGLAVSLPKFAHREQVQAYLDSKGVPYHFKNGSTGSVMIQYQDTPIGIARVSFRKESGSIDELTLMAPAVIKRLSKDAVLRYLDAAGIVYESDKEKNAIYVAGNKSNGAAKYVEISFSKNNHVKAAYLRDDSAVENGAAQQSPDSKTAGRNGYRQGLHRIGPGYNTGNGYAHEMPKDKFLKSFDCEPVQIPDPLILEGVAVLALSTHRR